MNVEGSEYLLTVAGLGLAMAGFSGVIGAFRQPGREYLPQEVEGMKLILESSFGAAFFALLPFPIIYSFSCEVVWAVCGIVLSLFLVIEVIRHGLIVSKLRSKDASAREEWGLKYFFLPVTILITVVVFLSSLNGSVLGYMWGIFWMLSVGGMQFFVFVSRFNAELEE